MASRTTRTTKSPKTPKDRIDESASLIVTRSQPTRKNVQTRSGQSTDDAFNIAKEDFYNQFRLGKITQLRNIINYIISVMNAIRRIETYLMTYPPGTKLVWKTTLGLYPLTMKQVNDAQSLLETAIKNLYYYVEVSRKSKSRKPRNGINDFSGQYQLAGAREGPFNQWLVKENFDYDDQNFWQFIAGQLGVDEDQLLIWNGIGMSFTFEKLLYISAAVNDLKDPEDNSFITPSPAMRDTLGSDRTPVIRQTNINNGRSSAITINQPADSQWTFFEAIRQDSALYKESNIDENDELIDPTLRFDEGHFRMYWFKKFITIGTYKLKDHNVELNNQQQKQVREEFAAINEYSNWVKGVIAEKKKQDDISINGPTLDIVS